MRNGKSFLPLAGAVFFVLALPYAVGSVTLSSTVLISGLAAMACNLLVGYAGLLSFCQGVFFGLGGYLAALLLIHAGSGLLPALLVAGLGSAIVAGVIGTIAIRRKGIYFVMLTWAFAQLFYFLAYSQPRITGGDNGLGGVARAGIDLFGWVQLTFHGDHAFYILTAICFLLGYAFLRRVTRSPLGAALVSIRENEQRMWALGYDPRHYKILAFMLSGAITGCAGALDAMLLGIVPLSNIDAGMSQNILIAAILGGSGSLFGSVIGATVLVLAGDFLSELWPRWQLILGVCLVLLVLFAPDGFSGLWRSAMNQFQLRTAKMRG